MKVVISEYAKFRSRAFLNWFPDAEVRRRYEGERLPDSFDLLILTGGPMSAHEKSRSGNPFLSEDMVLLQELARVGSKAPFTLGVCLGAQLMTFAFGGQVEDGPEELVGWNDINLVSTHPAFDGVESPLHCEIHANHITRLPKRARLIASSTFDAVEVFCVGDRMLASFAAVGAGGFIAWRGGSQVSMQSIINAPGGGGGLPGAGY